ncbi:MAG: hypothetical protein K2G56_03015, partial [Eubacterium sp.]|nr:hypothetical protein [Eubacterium sp.]
MKSRYSSIRSVIALVLVALMIGGFGYELFNIQILNHEFYTEQNNNVSTYTVPLEAARGDIVDRNGNVLVTNRQGNSIILDAAYFPSRSDNKERNTIIYNLLALFNKNKEETINNLPLTINKGKIAFTDDEDEIAKMKREDVFNLQKYATAQNCFDTMVEMYELEDYDVNTALKIGAVRYELTTQYFSIENPVTIAENVKNETVAAIKEDKKTYLGADVRAVSYREYTDSTIAPHILGTVRKINGEEYSELKDDGYGINDIIGESGIESACEKELRGVPGELTITIDNEGNVTEEITKNPIRGNTVMLTVDKDLQRVAQDKLKEICDKVSLAKGAGAVVVQDVNTGEILAAASYPTFDLQDYYDNYEKLAKNKRNPMWNRFALGTYAPGSTFKPMMACAALEEGVLNEDSVFKCTGLFQYYDVPFHCMNGNVHGSENVRLALRDSCNIFFFNCADALGITKINEYGKMFGLGEKTGVEIPEATGTFASPAVAEQLGRAWQMGDAIQAGIGQSYHLFTPLQLANYCATVANNGTRYESHFVKAIINSSNHSVDETGITVVEDLPISDKTFTIVKEGMRLVATWKYLDPVFNKIDTPVACKTGTSQVGMGEKKDNNGFLITFAPYNNPE